MNNDNDEREFTIVMNMIDNLLMSLMEDKINPVMIAGVLLARSVHLYKLQLSKDGIEKLINAISNDLRKPLSEEEFVFIDDDEEPTIH